MTPRKVLLIIMLAALAASALTGILAVLTTTGDALWRLMGTAIDTAVVTALLLPLSLLTDRPKLRAGGLSAMGTLLVGWLCVMYLMWMEHTGGYDLQWRVLSTFGFTLLAGLPASAALLLTNVKWARVAAWALVGLAAYAWLGTLAGTWIPSGTSSIFGFGNLSERIWGTALIPYGIGAITALLLVNLGMGDRRYFRWAGIFFGLVATVVGVGSVWSDNHGEFWSRVLGISLTACIVPAHINLVLMARLRQRQEWLKWATIGCSLAAGLAIVIVLAVVSSSNWDDPFLFRAAAAAAIAGGCGSIALIILSALNRRVDAPLVASVDMKEIQLACPRCGMRQTLPLGEAACSSCQLQIITQVVEPRCPACGYNLYKLNSDRCPECGHALKAQSAASLLGPEEARPVQPGGAASTPPVMDP
jgi:ribosomal protein L37E